MQHGLAPALDAATLYAAWHHRWCVEQQMTTGRQKGDPAVRTVALAPTDTPRRLQRLIANVPDDAAGWSSSTAALGGGTWRWRRDAFPPLPVTAAVAAYDVTPPPPRLRQEPFLLRALARVAALAAPSAVPGVASSGRILSRHRGSTVSLDVLGAWVTKRHGLGDGPFAGVYGTPVPAEATERAALRIRAVAAPGLVQFAAYVAETAFPVFAPAEVASFLPQWVDSRLDRSHRHGVPARTRIDSNEPA